MSQGNLPSVIHTEFSKTKWPQSQIEVTLQMKLKFGNNMSQSFECQYEMQYLTEVLK